MTRKDNIIIPRWFLEAVENTLRIQYNINIDKTTGETCQDRNIKESLNGVRKLLNGEELTGGERLERLQPPLPSNLDKTAKETAKGLTWKDVAIIITIYEAELEAGKISRYEENGTSSLKKASEMILKHFNELRKK